MKTFQAGTYINQGTYKSFQPNPINREWKIENMEIWKLLSQADRELGRLDMYSNYIPNIDLFISMHVLKEAIKSSKIEGTQTKIEEALLDKEDIPLDRRNDQEEVQNYTKAMEWAIKELGNLPFSNRLIRETHKVLLQGVRGAEKQPGEFRRSQNWIGGASISDAVFIPPVHSSVTELMSDIEKFLHNESNLLPELLKIAIVHYQFETIHPFLDGNGRVGRLLIPLYLVSRNILKKPILYLSDFFERNRKLYYDNLTIVRVDNNIEQWFKFFLVGIIETCRNGISTFDGIMQLQKKVDNDIQSLGNRMTSAKAVTDFLYQKPLVTADVVSKVAGISMPSAYKLINSLEKLGILNEVTGGQRGRIYVFDEYLSLFR
ncbi:Fic family protein [Maribellus comscasis]|uniref:Fic family protein n=1 Tax=Maribellus comscasis TaxID=2681766 RepID=A0A6I6JVI1_9BACT|nr:Fic family protein [Maribellus comscasis]QGY44172.1 Fic family protein [Maribellus comscasis]